MGHHNHDNDRNRDDRRHTEHYGQGQSGYGAGWSSPERPMMRNQGYAGPEDRGGQAMGTDDRFSGRGGESHWMDRSERDERVDRDRGAERGDPGDRWRGQGDMRTSYGEGRGSAGGGTYGGGGYGGSSEQMPRDFGPTYGNDRFGHGGGRPHDHGGGGGGAGGGYPPDLRNAGRQDWGRQASRGNDYGRDDFQRRDWASGNNDAGGHSRGGSYAGSNYGTDFARDDYRARSGRDDSGMYGRGDSGHAERPRMHYGKGPQGFQRSDDRIKEHVCEALADDDSIDATFIEVAVQGGEVTLTGSVESRWAKRASEDLVERQPGVREVHNQLRVAQTRGAGDRSGGAAATTATTATSEVSAAGTTTPSKHRA